MNRPWGHECAIDSQPTVFNQLSGPAGSLPAPRENTRFAAFAARFRPSKTRNAPFACSVVPSPTKTSDTTEHVHVFFGVHLGVLFVFPLVFDLVGYILMINLCF